MEVEMIRKTYHMCLPFEIVNKLLCQGKMYKEFYILRNHTFVDRAKIVFI